MRNLNMSALLFLMLIVSTAKAQPAVVFDIFKYGAKPNTDITEAFSSAFKEACASPTRSKVLIPKGTFQLGGVCLEGPCKAAVEIEVQATLTALTDKPTADGNWVSFKDIDGFTLSGGGTFDGQGPKAWGACNGKYCKELPINLRFQTITNGLVKDITSKDSKQFHVSVLSCKNLEFQHFTISAPAESINTDGIHISRSSNITINNSNIGTGDDCISIGQGSKQITITGVTCGPGHGISIGSLGKVHNEEPVVGVRVRSCTFSNTDNGVRIKTWPASSEGSVTDVIYEDIVMNNVNNPIIIDQVYCPAGQCNAKLPSKVKISNVSFKNIRGTSATPVAVKLECSSGIPCEGVEVADIGLKYTGKEAPAALSECNHKVKNKMRNLNMSALLFLMLIVSTAKAQPAVVFDIFKYGAKPNTDITEAFSSAFKEACASPTRSKVLIPKGTFQLGGVCLEGPCKAAVEIEVQATLTALTDKPTADGNWVSFKDIDGFTLSGGGTFDGQGPKAWGACNGKYCKELPINLRFQTITNGLVKDITSKDSKQFHVSVLSCKNLEFQHFTISAPAESINTDGIHISRSSNITINNSNIGTGDDCISIGQGSKQITITGVTCGPGHGISIGSLGKVHNEEPVVGVRVRSCTFSNTDNGVRIKTWPASSEGSVTDVIYEDIVMNNVNNPIIIDQVYCPAGQCNAKLPSKVKISNVSFKNIRGTSATPVAVKLECSSGIPCEGVEVADIGLKYTGKEAPAALSECNHVQPKVSGKNSLPICGVSA
ncbi:hypothetical protein Ddye_014271 [Dipteronia dyeriana]|uniref:Uncharacterized protein n=1 Tax=Dipteronia dyeriana TaxID=168575 RepID=A0AAE0CKD3_9ROSI|nr:hypothetical protein Ddye_014271 [Dipteronia dyeriana]